MEENKVLIWNITGDCNQDCPYCLEGHDKPKHPTTEQTKIRLENLLESLEGIWELRLNGGEVFDMPGFLNYLVPTILNQSQHKIAVLTNLTYLEDVFELSESTKDRLSFFSSSLHLITRKKGEKELIYTDPHEYLEKAKRIKETLARNNPHTPYYVNCVLLPSKLDEIKDFKPAYDQAGIPLFFQFLKTGVSPNLKPFKYSQEQLTLIEEITGLNLQKHESMNTAKSFRNHTCYAGVRYFIINEEGKAYTCHAALGDQEQFLGDISKGKLELRDKPLTCPHDICTTSIPKIKGIVE